MGTWSVTEARSWARERLANAGIDSVDADVRELLEWACDVTSQLDLPAALDPEQADKLRAGVSERALRIPLQHVTGRMYFRSLTLRSVPGVFVVRPETEVLAGLAIDEAAAAVAARGEARVVDLCTGSGAIALAVATESARTEVWAVEKEPDPFALACLNRDRVGACGVHLVRGDATHPATLGFLDGLIDVVVTNPPYVPADEMPTQPEAAADPHSALYGGSADGLDIPCQIIRRSLTLLRPGGTLLMEHSPSQDEALRTYAASLGMVEVSTSTDLAGRMRFLRACAPR
jgi:methyltransferase, hemK family